MKGFIALCTAFLIASLVMYPALALAEEEDIDVRTAFSEDVTRGSDAQIHILVENNSTYRMRVTSVGVWFQWMEPGVYIVKESSVYLEVEPGESFTTFIKFDVPWSTKTGNQSYDVKVEYDLRDGFWPLYWNSYMWNSTFHDMYVHEGADIPSTPGNLVADAREGGILLSWSSPYSDGGTDILGFRIFRGESLENVTLLETVDNIISHMDTNVSSNVTYYYRVNAFNSMGESRMSNVAIALLPHDVLEEEDSLMDDEGEGFLGAARGSLLSILVLSLAFLMGILFLMRGQSDGNKKKDKQKQEEEHKEVEERKKEFLQPGWQQAHEESSSEGYTGRGVLSDPGPYTPPPPLTIRKKVLPPDTADEPTVASEDHEEAAKKE